MKEAALVIIKPDAIARGFIGNILTQFASIKLELVAIQVLSPGRKQVEDHYRNIKGKPFFKGTVDYFLGKFHKRNCIIAIVYVGIDAVAKCRKLAGATNPEEAAPDTLRGRYGRITTKNIYENVVHVSSSRKEAEREIKLWFAPDAISRKVYPTKQVIIKNYSKRIWK